MRPTITKFVRTHTAFTILEVLIALTFFSITAFAILQLLTTNFRILRSLNVTKPDLGSVATELTLALRTNRQIDKLHLAGDFGKVYPDASWTANLSILATNSGSFNTLNPPGLYAVELSISWHSGQQTHKSQSTLLIYLPRGPGGSP